MSIVLSPGWELSINHAASSYGQPVLVQRGALIAYGPNNIISNESGFLPAWRHVEQLAGMLDLDEGGKILVGRFVSLGRRLSAEGYNEGAN